MGEKRIPTYLSLSPRGRMERDMLQDYYGDRYQVDTVERCIHREASRLPKDLKERLKEEQRICPMAGKCEEILKRIKNLEEKK